MSYRDMNWAIAHYDELSDEEKGFANDCREREREAYLERKHLVSNKWYADESKEPMEKQFHNFMEAVMFSIKKDGAIKVIR